MRSASAAAWCRASLCAATWCCDASLPPVQDGTTRGLLRLLDTAMRL
jgi:hypothetical protein